MAVNHWRDTLNSTILRLLYPANNPHQGAQLHLDNEATKIDTTLNTNISQGQTGPVSPRTTYYIQTATLDLLLQYTRHTTRLIQTARIILTLKRNAHAREASLHTHLVWDLSQTPPSPSYPYSILDTETLSSSIPRASQCRISTSSQSPDLRSVYQAYIAAINDHTLTTSLPYYTHTTITHNSLTLERAKYQRLMEDAQEAVSGLTFTVAEEDLVIDEARQMVAARIRFRGKARRAWGGVVPKGNGVDVDFGEVVFYWFQEGKIREVVSLVDMEAYRAQVRGDDTD